MKQEPARQKISEHASIRDKPETSLHSPDGGRHPESVPSDGHEARKTDIGERRIGPKGRQRGRIDEWFPGKRTRGRSLRHKTQSMNSTKDTSASLGCAPRTFLDPPLATKYARSIKADQG